MTERTDQYAVVRKKTTVRIDNGVRYEEVLGYNTKDQVVYIGLFTTYPDGRKGHVLRYVEEDGYWVGGSYDPINDISGLFGKDPFVEK